MNLTDAFFDHVRSTLDSDGNEDLQAAEVGLAADLEMTPGIVSQLCKQAAHNARAAWERSESSKRIKVLRGMQQTLDFDDIDLDVRIPLGDSIVVALGNMTDERIRLRMDLRTKAHLEESRAYDDEMSAWMYARGLLLPGETIEECRDRLST